MSDPEQRRNLIRAQSVRDSAHPVLVECDDGGAASDKALSIVPLMDGRQVAGIEVHCSCGSSVIIECLYEQVAAEPSGQTIDPAPDAETLEESKA